MHVTGLLFGLLLMINILYKQNRNNTLLQWVTSGSKKCFSIHIQELYKSQFPPTLIREITEEVLKAINIIYILHVVDTKYRTMLHQCKKFRS